MELQKETNLVYDYKDKLGNVLARLSTTLTGDGSTPIVMTSGGVQNTIGYDDYGTPIFSEIDEDELKRLRREFMANAIKVQKEMTAANGIDPSVVNMIGAEK